MWAEDWNPWADKAPRYGPAPRHRPFQRFPPPYARLPLPAAARAIPPPPGPRYFPTGGPRFYPPILPPSMPEIKTPHASAEMREPPREMPNEIATVQLWSDFDAPAKPQTIKFGTEISATRCMVSWKLPDFQEYSKIKQTIEVTDDLVVLSTEELLPHINSYRLKTTPGNTYVVTLTIKDSNGKVLAKGDVEFRAYFSLEEMERLHARAVEYTGNILHPFRYLYRCKPKCYWDDIHFRTQGIMEVYIKDNNGQEASPINGEIHGLFFSAKLAPDGTLPNTSPFGDVRMILPAMTLLDPARTNMYFADFYCNQAAKSQIQRGPRPHYATVVITQRGSRTDKFCMERLKPLNQETNHFLRVVYNPNFQYFEFFVNRNVWVEIYYTENIPLHWGAFDTIIPVGAGTSKIGGLPHDKQCTTCNMYLFGRPIEPILPKLENFDVTRNSTLDIVMELESQRTGHAPAGEDLELVETLVSVVDCAVYKIENDEILTERMKLDKEVHVLKNTDEAQKRLDELDTYDDSRQLISRIRQNESLAPSAPWQNKIPYITQAQVIKETIPGVAKPSSSVTKSRKRKRQSTSIPNDEYESDSSEDEYEEVLDQPSMSELKIPWNRAEKSPEWAKKETSPELDERSLDCFREPPSKKTATKFQDYNMIQPMKIPRFENWRNIRIEKIPSRSSQPRQAIWRNDPREEHLRMYGNQKGLYTWRNSMPTRSIGDGIEKAIVKRERL